jgi:2-dehydropantoate 2-reductase
MKIAVVGAGGVGGYFGGRLALAGHDVAIVARGPHLAAIRERGLRVRSVRGDFAAVVQANEDPAEFGPCDVVLFCVKSYDTEAAAARLGPLLAKDTAVVSLQNGIDNEEKIAATVGPGRVVGGAAFIFSTIAEPRVVAHT